MLQPKPCKETSQHPLPGARPACRMHDPNDGRDGPSTSINTRLMHVLRAVMDLQQWKMFDIGGGGDFLGVNNIILEIFLIFVGGASNENNLPEN